MEPALDEEPTAGPRRLKLTLAYDGTGYVGWQRQAVGRSIQASLEAALERIEGRPVRVSAAGRTDAGVHALGQVAACHLSHPIAADRLVVALNANLPNDIRVLGAEVVPADFHPRYGARVKRYRYQIVGGGIPLPFGRRYAWQLPGALDAGLMDFAAADLVGTHDFRAFQAAGSAVASTVRTVARCQVSCGPALDLPGRLMTAGGSGDLVVVDIAGDGFLRHMVRIVVGTLVEIGMRRRGTGSVASALRAASRDAAGPTAPAHGLFLVEVTY